jgi:hypothetical protein
VIIMLNAAFMMLMPVFMQAALIGVQLARPR